MSNKLRTLLFPECSREVPQRRLILNILRSTHILCFSVLCGGIFFHQSQEVLTAWMLGVVITGLAMFMVDLYGSFIALFEVRGISILIKILLLMCIPYVNEDAQIALFIIVIIFSSFVSHSTRRVRHKSFMSLAFNQKYGPQDSIKGKRK